jgi:hypothetical protein
MAQVKINFDCDENLKEQFEITVKSNGFSHMAEAFRDFMRRTVLAFRGVNPPSMNAGILPNSSAESQEKSNG